MVITAEFKQFFPLRENTFRHVVESDGRYPRAMTPSDLALAENVPSGYRQQYIISVLACVYEVDGYNQML